MYNSLEQHPTLNQVKALGHLMISGYILSSPTIGKVDLDELEQIGLCVQTSSIHWDATSLLMDEQAPFMMLIEKYWEALRYYEELSQQFRIPLPTNRRDDDVAHSSLVFVNGIKAANDMMDYLVLEIGRNLAARWQYWKHLKTIVIKDKDL